MSENRRDPIPLIDADADTLPCLPSLPPEADDGWDIDDEPSDEECVARVKTNDPNDEESLAAPNVSHRALRAVGSR
jgi:hypothetical protein